MKIWILFVGCLILCAQAQQEQNAEQTVEDAVGEENIENLKKGDGRKKVLTKEVKYFGKPLGKKRFCSKPCVCGIPNPAANSTLNRFPFAMYMVLKTDNGQIFLGGGVLINSRNALTTASGLKGARVEDVTASVVRLVSPEARGYNTKISAIILHPDYNEATMDNDLAIVKFAQAIPFGNGIRPVCLPPVNYLFAGRQGVTAAWANFNGGVVSDTVRINIANIISNPQCQGLANRGSITNNMICAGEYVAGSSACQSDKGGPLTIVNKEYVNRVLKNRHYLVGVASYGNGCVSQLDAPGVYTRIASPSTYSFILNNSFDGCYCQ